MTTKKVKKKTTVSKKPKNTISVQPSYFEKNKKKWVLDLALPGFLAVLVSLFFVYHYDKYLDKKAKQTEESRLIDRTIKEIEYNVSEREQFLNHSENRDNYHCGEAGARYYKYKEYGLTQQIARETLSFDWKYTKNKNWHSELVEVVSLGRQIELYKKQMIDAPVAQIDCAGYYLILQRCRNSSEEYLKKSNSTLTKLRISRF